jgi:hypothetical protein
MQLYTEEAHDAAPGLRVPVDPLGARGRCQRPG